jgi:hypothetical protein
VKRPAFQFYPADWRKDMALQSCGVSARGLWMDMLCIAHECEPYGHLTVNGNAMTPAQIGRHTGLTAKECQALLDELDQAGVLSRTEGGVIYSRRMVRDEDLRNRRAAGGSGGAEHGAKGAKDGFKGGRPRADKGGSETPLGGESKPPPSSSSSSSSSNIPPNPRKRGKANVHEFPPGFEPLWVEYPKKAAKDAASKAFARLAPDDALLARLMAALRQQKRSEQWTKDGGAFVPNCATWINGRRWDDELPIAGAGEEPWAGAI